MDSDEKDLQSDLLMTAVSLLAEEFTGSVSTGSLELRQNGDTNAWDVHKLDDGILVFVDAIRPAAFPSARHLAGYLYRLEKVDVSTVDLPSTEVGTIGL